MYIHDCFVVRWIPDQKNLLYTYMYVIMCAYNNIICIYMYMCVNVVTFCYCTFMYSIIVCIHTHKHTHTHIYMNMDGVLSFHGINTQTYSVQFSPGL